MKDQAFYITGVSKKEYLDWCKDNKKPSYKAATKRDFFERIRQGKLCRDAISGKLVVKRVKTK